MWDYSGSTLKNSINSFGNIDGDTGKKKNSHIIYFVEYVEQNKHNKKIRSLEKKNIKAWHDSKGHR